MTIREALNLFSGANVTHPAVPPMKLQKALLVILSAARREAERQEQFLDEVNKDTEEDT
jgi:hypothetical protein